MKELSIEEKAEAYDKAIGRAKKELDTCGSQDCDAARQLFRLFPELKDSDDERIRKDIIVLIKDWWDRVNKDNISTKKQMLAWLEKQGEHANFINKIQIGDKVTRNKDGVLVNLSQLNRVAKKDEKQGGQKPNYCHHEVDLSNCSEEYHKAYYDGWNNCNMQHSQCNSEKNDVIKCLINGMRFYYEDNEEATWGTEKFSMKVKDILSWLEKQGEQPQGKSALEAAKEEKIDNANKAEPKFKVGDWICHTVYKKPLLIVEDLGEGDFRTEPKSIITAKEFREGVFRLWTIQDAKDGDVLANDHHILILRELGYSWAANGNPDSLYAYCGIKPNGNFELEQKGYCFCGTLHTHPATKEQCDTLMKAMADASYTFDFDKKELKKIEQKSAWNEEDKRIMKALIDYFMWNTDSQLLNEFTNREVFAWLKSLKDRVQPKQEWSEEDELRMENILSVIEGHGYPMEVEWIKSIKHRVQPKQEWSEDDEKIQLWIIEYIKNLPLLYSEIMIDGEDISTKEYTDKVKFWLKSLRPQSHWKPSDEQMEALSNALSLAKNCGEENAFDLNTLYEQLKKLREELL